MRYTKHVERIAATALALCLSASPGSAQQPAPAPVLTLSARPELVGEGIVSASLSEFAPTLTPDGRTMIFAVTDVGFTRMTLMESRLVNGRWQAPTVLPFSGTWNDGDGALSPDGSRFLFISNRPVSGDTAKADLDLWEVSRTRDGNWGEPRRLPDSVNSNVNEVYPSIAADGTLYFVSTRRGPAASWPRSRRVSTAAEVAAELRGVTRNGLRNIYRLDVGEIADQVRSGSLKE